METAEKGPESLVMSEAQVVTGATVAAAERLGLTAGDLASVIGVCEDTVLRMGRLEHLLRKGTPPFEQALLLIRLFRALNAVTHADAGSARAWLRNANLALGGIPAEKIATRDGLLDVLAHLDERLGRDAVAAP
ncbi:hypothetical protein REJC140_02597 [Pseudorhizobium endolithicum]|uniref:Antitoxin Xre/MbcA/ParS-like toxin-binding domain-containing protein n=1 Tax=Pseudorhizobium endolithicum TaxID=1191678 RepID=A0ABM8PG90_9HYPH|nr:antitoxin Xre/MbcA/ParS toxin-binding domain-containing protein [Pseudorhizobium endolithicum]CAD7028206.1 hypothetical protein REJC140_02597 [Pseudorhizobium endolithicum]